MAKSEYYFPLLYRRLLVSTTGWKDEEFGAYLRLLIHQFDNNNRISPDLDDLKRICPSIKKNWPLISKKFKTDENGMLYNEVMSEIYNEAQNKQERSRENGKHGGRPKNKEPEKTQQDISGFENDNLKKPYSITKDITKEKESNKEKLFVDLSAMELNNSIEYIHRVTQRQYSSQQWADYWQAFKIQYINDFHQNRADVIKHFRNWLKQQKNGVENHNTDKQPVKRFKF